MDLFEQIKNEMRKVYLQDKKPITVGFSGGKDSSLLLSLLWDVLLELPESLRTKTVHILNSNTGVEAPAMEEYVERTLMKIERKAAFQKLPIRVHRVNPNKKNNFWYKVLGRGNLISTPKTKHRGCTHWLKIGPMQEKLKELISSAPVTLGEDKTILTMWLGVREEESARRKASIQKWQLSEQSLWAKHSDFDEIMCFHPLKFVDGDSLWYHLLDRGTLPFGVTVDELAVQYGEGILECSIKVSTEQGNSCGANGSRLGCWVCGMTSGNDPMLLRYIQEGYNYAGLLEWKGLMLAMRNDLRFREVFPRLQYNRIFTAQESQFQIDLFETNEETKVLSKYETYKRAHYEKYAPGGMTQHGRRILLEHLLYIQERDGLNIIHENEIQAILDAWEDTEGFRVERSEIQPKASKYDGELVFLPDKSINRKETKNPNKVFYITVELNKEEPELYSFIKKRQKVTQTSLFFFPSCQEFQDIKAVWNKVTFVVCGEGITSQLEAAEHVYKWLGWEYGAFTKETKAAAINFLILSALSEGLTKRNKKLTKAIAAFEPLPISQNEDGQLAFAI